MNPEDKIFKRQFEVLFREYFTGLVYFARKYTGDLDSAKEIVHSVFVRVWEKRADFEWTRPAKSYLFTAVYNRSLNYLRDSRKFVGSDILTLNPPAGSGVVFNDSLDTAELEKRIDQALGKLPEKCREIFEMSRFGNKKYSEISEQLGISVKTVESQMSKALHILKEALKDYLYILVLALLKNLPNW